MRVQVLLEVGSYKIFIPMEEITHSLFSIEGEESEPTASHPPEKRIALLCLPSMLRFVNRLAILTQAESHDKTLTITNNTSELN